MENHALGRRLFAAWMGERRLDSLKLNFTPADFKRLGCRVGDAVAVRVPGVRGTVGEYAFIARAYRARATVTDAQVLKPYAAAAARLANVVTPFSKAVVKTDGTFVADDLIGSIMEVVAGTGLSQFSPIFDNNVTTLSIAAKDSVHRVDAADTTDALATILDATSDIGIFDTREAVPTTAAVDLGIGVALGDVTNGNLGFYIEHGFAMTKVKGDTGATPGTALVRLCPSAVAGEAIPTTAAGITGPEAASYFAFLIHAYTGASARRLAFVLGRNRLSF